MSVDPELPPATRVKASLFGIVVLLVNGVRSVLQLVRVILGIENVPAAPVAIMTASPPALPVKDKPGMAVIWGSRKIACVPEPAFPWNSICSNPLTVAPVKFTI